VAKKIVYNIINKNIERKYIRVASVKAAVEKRKKPVRRK
jgi:hypothetical protein